MSTWTLSGRMPRRGVQRYLHPREEVRYVCRRHPIVIWSAVGLWLLSVVAYLGLEFASRAQPALHLGGAGMLVFLAGSLFLGWKGLDWWETCYVFTNERVLSIEGIVSRLVVGIPFRLVIDITYRRTFVGRLLGYGDLELNLSGRPNLRTLTSLSKPDRAYALVLSLSHAGDDTEPLEAMSESRNDEAAPQPDIRPPIARCLCCCALRCVHETGK